MSNRNAAAAPKRDESGRWYFVADVGPGPDGRRRQVKKRGFATKKEAQQALDSVRQAGATASYVPPARATLAEYLDAWLAGLPATGLRPSTVDSYRRQARHITDTLGGRRVDQITALDLDALYAQLLADGRRTGPGGLSPRTVRYIHTILSKALSDGVRKDVLARNVAERSSPPSAKSTKAPEMAWWTPEQLRTFLAATADDPLGPLFRVAALTGLRRGEVCALRWSDVDLEAARVEVRRQLGVVRGAPNGGLTFSDQTKTDHGRRSIDLDEGTVGALRTQRARQAEWKLAVGPAWSNSHDLVFTDPTGQPLDPENVANRFGRRVARTGLPRLRFHDLRHTHVAHLIGAGEQLLLISRRLGHASASFTADRYGHLFHDAGS
jgi:integrase